MNRQTGGLTHTQREREKLKGRQTETVVHTGRQTDRQVEVYRSKNTIKQNKVY